METIQFHCPACRTQLRVPPAAAGFQGPCPACGRDIIGPIPERGLAARLVPEDAFSPFPGTPADERRELPEDPVATAPEPLTPPAPDPPAAAQPAAPEPAATEEPFSPFADPPAEAETEPEPEAVKESPEKESSESLPPTPAKDATENAECLAPRSYRRLRTGILVLSCLLCSLISFVAGYITAQKAQVFPAPIFADGLMDSDLPETPVEIEVPEIEEINLSPQPAEETEPEEEVELSTNPSDPEPRPAAKATLEAFLSAPDWSSRMAYVQDPDEVRAAMKAWGEARGGGPIETTVITSTHVFADQEHFLVETASMPSGFPVTLQRVGEDWRIDWEIFEEFHDDAYHQFASGKGGEIGEFHLYLKPHPTDDPNGFARYQLTAPIKGRSYPAFAKRGRLAQAKITALIESEAVQENEALQKLLEGNGIPLVLKLSYQSKGQGQNFLLIEDLVAQGWGR